MNILSERPLPQEVQDKIDVLRGARQKAFVIEYARDGNGSRAARNAGYSAKVANRTATKLLSKADIRACVEAIQTWKQTLFVLESHEVIRELGRVASADITDVVTWDGNEITIKPSVALTKDQTAAIYSIKKTKGAIEVRMHPKLPALELLGKHLGIFIEENSGTTSLEEKLNKVVDIYMERMRDSPIEPYARRPPVPTGHSTPH
jgi:phage terminase small subunit